MDKTVLTSESIPHVALEQMNQTHFEELEMVQSLGECLIDYQDDNDKQQQIAELLEQWLAHTVRHFERENKLMQQSQFPMYSVHSGEHYRVLDEMQAVVGLWTQNHDITLLEQYVFEVWPQWFKQHVNSMDMVTAQFATMHGYDHLPETVIG